MSEVAPTFSTPSWTERSRVRVASWLDRLAIRGMSLAFDATLMPTDREEWDARASAAPYLVDELVREPRRFFAFLSGATSIDTPPVTGCRPIEGGAVVSQRLASAYTPYHRARNAPTCSENDWIPIEHWRHHDRPAATIILLHGFTMGNPRIDAGPLMVSQWFGAGLDVVLMALPFHGERSAMNARFSGELFASWHVGRLNEAVRQAVNDVHRVFTLLRSERPDVPVGIVGGSLGGYVAALLAGLEPDLAFVIPIAAPVHLGVFPSTLFTHSRYGKAMAPPLAPEELIAAYRVHCPLTHPLILARERVMVIAGRGDCIVSPTEPLALWRHWGEPALHWYDGSHVTPFRRARIVAAGIGHLRTIGVLPAES